MNPTVNPTLDNLLDMDTALVEYVRENTLPVGVIMAAIDRATDEVRIGWSLVRSGSDDKFNKHLAKEIAIGRMELAHVHKVTIPFDICESGLLEKFALRCMKYYRTDKVLVFGRIRKDLDERNQLRYVEYTYTA